MMEDPNAGTDSRINRATIEEELANHNPSGDLNSTQNQTPISRAPEGTSITETDAAGSQKPNNISNDMSNIKPTITTSPEVGISSTAVADTPIEKAVGRTLSGGSVEQVATSSARSAIIAVVKTSVDFSPENVSRSANTILS